MMSSSWKACTFDEGVSRYYVCVGLGEEAVELPSPCT